MLHTHIQYTSNYEVCIPRIKFIGQLALLMYFDDLLKLIKCILYYICSWYYIIRTNLQYLNYKYNLQNY